MTQEAIQEIIRKQRNYFYTGATLNIDFRITALKKLQTSIQSHQEQINAALKSDLGKAASRATCANPVSFSAKLPIC